MLQKQENVKFNYLGNIDGAEVYHCENDGNFYFRLPETVSYFFKEVRLPELVERYSRIAAEKRLLSREEREG